MKLHLIALAALAASLPAHSVTSNLGPLGTEGFGNFFPLGAAVFSDTFTFSLDAPKTITGLSGSSGIQTMGLVLKDFDGDTIGIDATPSSFSFNLGAGIYALNFIGLDANPSSFYGGVVTAAPIPEPQTYALMLAGLGMVGFLAKRRSGAA